MSSGSESFPIFRCRSSGGLLLETLSRLESSVRSFDTELIDSKIGIVIELEIYG